MIPPELTGLDVRPIASGTLEMRERVTHAAIVTRGVDAAVSAVVRNLTSSEVVRVQERLARSETADRGGSLWPR